MNVADGPRPTRVRWLIFGLACAASGLLYLHRYSWGIIKPAFKEENPGFDDETLGWLDSAFLATYAFGQVPGGMAGDRFGPRATMTIFTLVWSLAVAGVAWTAGFWQIFGARALFGLAQAGAYPVISKMTRTWFPLASRTSVQGIVAAMGRVGGACAAPIIATLLMGVLGLSWQTTLAVLMAPGILLAIQFWIIARNSPREHPWANEAEHELVEGPAPIAPVADANKPAPVFQRSAAAMITFGMLLLYAFASTFQDQFYVNWLPSFLKEGRNFDFRAMGLYAPLPLLGGAVGGIIGGMLNDTLIRTWGNRRWARSLVAFTGKSIAAGMVVVSMGMEDGRVALLVLVAARVFGDWSLPTQWGAVTDMGGRAAATMFGIVNTVGALGGFVAGPVFGYLKQNYDWDGVFYGVAAMCLASAVTWLFIDCTQRVVRD